MICRFMVQEFEMEHGSLMRSLFGVALAHGAAPDQRIALRFFSAMNQEMRHH